MQDNPYSAILGTVRSDADSRSVFPWQMGKVKSVEPLIIETSGQMLERENLLINYQLIRNEEKFELYKPTGTLSGTVDCPTGNISAMSITGGEIQAEGTFYGVLKIDDQVVLLRSSDGQSFVILCKVVSP